MFETVRIKKSLSAGGVTAVYINISYPDFGRFSAVSGFYKGTADRFCEFASGSLLPRASAKAADSAFVPFGAVMHSELLYSDTRFLSVCTEAYVFDGGQKHGVLLYGVTWDGERGVILPPEQIIPGGRRRLYRLFAEQTGAVGRECQRLIKKHGVCKTGGGAIILCPTGKIQLTF